MRKRGLCCRPVSVCLSVRHVGVLYPDGWNYRQTSSSARRAIILVFFTPYADDQFQGEPRQRGRKLHGVGFCNFWLKSLSISETVWDRPMIAMER